MGMGERFTEIRPLACGAAMVCPFLDGWEKAIRPAGLKGKVGPGRV
jgi:hypothetical protein